MPNEVVEFDGRAVFVADDGVSGRGCDLDGTATGNALLADINVGFGSSDPSHLTVANGALFFFAK